MHSRRVILAAAVLALGLAGCNKDTPNTPAPKVDSPPATPGAGGPAATKGGLASRPTEGPEAGKDTRPNADTK